MRCQIPPGKFSCRCECFNRKDSCSASCQCKNCGNVYGQRLEGKSDDIKRSRKRAKHASQSSKQSSLCCLKERGEGLKVSGWTKLEHCLFVHTLKHFEQTKDTFTTGDLHEMYNVLVDVTRKNLKFTQAGRLLYFNQVAFIYLTVMLLNMPLNGYFRQRDRSGDDTSKIGKATMPEIKATIATFSIKFENVSPA